MYSFAAGGLDTALADVQNIFQTRSLNQTSLADILIEVLSLAPHHYDAQTLQQALEIVARDFVVQPRFPMNYSQAQTLMPVTLSGPTFHQTPGNVLSQFSVGQPLSGQQFPEMRTSPMAAGSFQQFQTPGNVSSQFSNAVQTSFGQTPAPFTQQFSPPVFQFSGSSPQTMTPQQSSFAVPQPMSMPGMTASFAFPQTGSPRSLSPSFAVPQPMSMPGMTTSFQFPQTGSPRSLSPPPSRSRSPSPTSSMAVNSLTRK